MIEIKKSPTADSRTATGNPTKEDLLQSTIQHINDVQKAMEWMSETLMIISERHDHTKISDINGFYDIYSKKVPPDIFKDSKWFKLHLTERHHLNDRCPADVNLFDVLERIADITMAGMARSGSIYADTIDPEILVRAYKNTIDLLQSQIKVIEDKEDE